MSEKSDMSEINVLIVTGEVSGDRHGANLAKALKQQNPAVRLFGEIGRAHV
mgnify:CR=1 FL=1